MLLTSLVWAKDIISPLCDKPLFELPLILDKFAEAIQAWNPNYTHFIDAFFHLKSPAYLEEYKAFHSKYAASLPLRSKLTLLAMQGDLAESFYDRNSQKDISPSSLFLTIRSGTTAGRCRHIAHYLSDNSFGTWI